MQPGHPSALGIKGNAVTSQISCVQEDVEVQINRVGLKTDIDFD